MSCDCLTQVITKYADRRMANFFISTNIGVLTQKFQSTSRIAKLRYPENLKEFLEIRWFTIRSSYRFIPIFSSNIGTHRLGGKLTLMATTALDFYHSISVIQMGKVAV